MTNIVNESHSADSVVPNAHLAEIDIMKGLGIICAVMDHAGIPNFIFYPFEVSLFFYIGGWCFNIERCKTIRGLLKYLKRQIIRLYIPLIVWNTLFVLLNNVFMSVGIYTDNPSFMLSDLVENQYGLDSYLSLAEMGKQIIRIVFLVDTSKIGGMSWFIRALFVITVGYAIVSWLLSKIRIQDIARFQVFISASLLILVVLAILRWNVPYVIISMIEYYGMFAFGRILRNHKEIFSSRLFGVLSLVVIILNAVIQYSLNYKVTILQVAAYTIASFSAFCLCWWMARVIKKSSLCGRISYVGNHTMPIIFLQFLSFKIVTFLEICIYGLPLFCLASFPILRRGLAWSIILIIVGIGFPLLLDYVSKKIIKRIFGERRG